MYTKTLAAAAIVVFACFCLPSSGASAAGLSAPSTMMRASGADTNVVQVWHRGHWRGGHWRGGRGYWGPGIAIYPYPYYGYPYDPYYYDDGYYGRPYVSPCYRRCRAEHGPRYCYDRCER